MRELGVVDVAHDEAVDLQVDEEQLIDHDLGLELGDVDGVRGVVDRRLVVLEQRNLLVIQVALRRAQPHEVGLITFGAVAVYRVIVVECRVVACSL